MVILYIVIPVFIIYSILIMYFWIAWRSVPVYHPKAADASVKISVIIPARNEEHTIGQLLEALREQTYPAPLFEVIVVDDHSGDNTAGIVRQFSFATLIQLKEDGINSYKKKAIETGINAATGDLIVTTDADCVPPASWLATMAAFRAEKGSAFIAAPVVFNNNKSLLQVFQALDFITLQGITGAAVHRGFLSMCNGANLAYDKRVFTDVGGFTGIDAIASGDDMLLMHKIKSKYPEKVHYLKSKDAIVSTRPMETWKDFFRQRIRWASKATVYKDKKITVVLTLVYLLNLCFLGLLAAGFISPVLWLYLLGLWVAKTLVEFPFVSSVASFFEKRSLLVYFFFFQPLHIAYTIISGLFGQFGSYQWKGRRVN